MPPRHEVLHRDYRTLRLEGVAHDSVLHLRPRPRVLVRFANLPRIPDGVELGAEIACVTGSRAYVNGGPAPVRDGEVSLTPEGPGELELVLKLRREGRPEWQPIEGSLRLTVDDRPRQQLAVRADESLRGVDRSPAQMNGLSV